MREVQDSQTGTCRPLITLRGGSMFGALMLKPGSGQTHGFHVGMETHPQALKHKDHTLHHNIQILTGRKRSNLGQADCVTVITNK